MAASEKYQNGNAWNITQSTIKATTTEAKAGFAHNIFKTCYMPKALTTKIRTKTNTKHQ